MQKRYGALRFFSLLYKILSILLFIGVLFAAIGAAIVGFSGGTSLSFDPATNQIVSVPAAPNPVGGIISALVIILFGGLSALSLFAFANIFDLLIATEENTRASASLLNHIRKQGQSGDLPPF